LLCSFSICQASKLSTKRIDNRHENITEKQSKLVYVKYTLVCVCVCDRDSACE